MKIAAIIQARMGSTRLPGKVMRLLGGMTVLERIARSARAAAGVDVLLVATSTAPGDDEVAAFCAAGGILCFRGSEEDVLERFRGAAESADADAVVRITGDCPLYDGSLLGEMLTQFRDSAAGPSPVHYLSNTLRRTYPRGLDTEIFLRTALERAACEARDPYQREHVTPFFYQNPDLFSLRNFEAGEDHSSHRWTLDTAEDWDFMTAVAAHLPPTGPWDHQTILNILREHPEISALNAGVKQKTH